MTRARLRWGVVLGAAVACADAEVDGRGPPAEVSEDDASPTDASCGDGVVDPGEACDDGEANADDVADACRTDCTLPSCGDGVVDSGEECDDANRWGGDGCSPDCRAETLAGEAEPNDAWWQANPASSGESVLGALPEGDVDCWAVDVDENGWLSARASGVDGTCPPVLTLRLYGDEGGLLADALTHDDDDDGCGRIGPYTHPSAAYLVAGRYTVCVEGRFRSEVPSYMLQLTTGDDSCLGITPGPDNDLDGDGIADACDPDMDGDGVPNEIDVCPRVSDGPNTPVARTASDGFLRHWLVAAGLRGDPVGPAGACDPSTTARLGDDDATATPALGDRAGSVPLRIWMPGNGRINFLDISTVSPHREAYAVTWVRSDSATPAVLHVGADDGVVAWMNGEHIGAAPTCQGVTVDAFAWPVSLHAGWNRLVFKVRDHGGGWGLVARFKTPGGAVIGDLETSPVGPWRWDRNQPDRDGDGVGDSCDPEP